jgi:hypothetical protein
MDKIAYKRIVQGRRWQHVGRSRGSPDDVRLPPPPCPRPKAGETVIVVATNAAAQRAHEGLRSSPAIVSDNRTIARPDGVLGRGLPHLTMHH